MHSPRRMTSSPAAVSSPWLVRSPYAARLSVGLRGCCRAATTVLREGDGTQNRSGGVYPRGVEPEGALRGRDASRSRGVSEHHADDRGYRGSGEKGAEETLRRAARESSASSLIRVCWSRRTP